MAGYYSTDAVVLVLARLFLTRDMPVFSIFTPTCACLLPLCTLLFRSDPEFLYQVLGEVIKAGATTLNIPDTTGWNLPHEFGGLIAAIKANTPGADNVIISTHCQNDLGLSTANSLAGAMSGVYGITLGWWGSGILSGVVLHQHCKHQQQQWCRAAAMELARLAPGSIGLLLAIASL